MTCGQLTIRKRMGTSESPCLHMGAQSFSCVLQSRNIPFRSHKKLRSSDRRAESAGEWLLKGIANSCIVGSSSGHTRHRGKPG